MWSTAHRDSNRANDEAEEDKLLEEHGKMLTREGCDKSNELYSCERLLKMTFIR